MARQLLLSGNSHHVFGIVGLGNTYGTVLSYSETDEVDEFIFEDEQGDAGAVLLHNDRKQVEVECLYDSTKTAVTIGLEITLPDTTKARVTQIKRTEGNKDARKISFTAKRWKSIGDATMTELHGS